MCLVVGTVVLPCLTARLEGGQQEDPKSLEKLLSLQITTAAKYKQALSEASASLTIITAEDIDQYGYRTLEDVLQSIPGFYISNDRNYSYVGTRGFGRPTDYNNRILLMLNGHTMNEGVFGSAQIGTEFGLDLNLVDRIEIIRGPGSALYGTSALFAVINVITKRGGDLQGGRVAFEAGSFGLRNGTVVAGQKLASGLEYTLAGHWMNTQGPDLYFKEFDTPETNSGRARGQDWDKSRGLYAAVTYRDFSFQGSFTSRTKGIPTASFDTLFNDPGEKSKDNFGFMELQYERDLSPDKNILVRGYYNRYDYSGTYPYADLLNYDSSTDSWMGGEARFRWDVATNNRLILGLEYQNHPRADYKYFTPETVFMDANWPFSVVSVFAQDEFQVAYNFSLTLGVRHDEYSNAKGHTSPRFGAVYHPFPSSTAKLLYGEAFRVPSPYEIYIDDPVSGFKPNLDLNPEIIRTLELSWEQKFGKQIYMFLSLFRYRMTDLMDWAIDPADGLFQSQNVSLVNAYGLELGLQGQLGRNSRLFCSYSWQHARDNATSQPLTNSPVHLYKGGLTISLFGALTAAIQGTYESSRLAINGTRTDPFALVNLTLLSRPLFGRVVLSFQIRNVLDANYGYPGGLEHVQPVIFQNGRNVIFRAEYHF
jgi:outer membrane receptor for ferrienterochelin and colicins